MSETRGRAMASNPRGQALARCQWNLAAKAGVSRRDAMKTTGHKTERVFERDNIRTTEGIHQALIKVGQFSPATVT